LFEILKFSPLGFAVSNLDAYGVLPRLDVLGRRSDEETRVPFSVRLVAPADWPERVEDRNFFVGGRSLADAVTARPRRKKLPSLSGV